MEKEPKLFRFEEMKFESVGEKVSLKTVEGTNVTLLNCRFEKGCMIPSHHHASEQITFLSKGCLKGKIGGREYLLRSGEGIVIPPNLPHEWMALEETITLEVFSPPREKPNFR